ncbi:hydroxyacylglutathione hydrolase [Microbulbifer sp. JMSA008]|uniref:hydroxyacylglutathione hydrolase n=1 Tax=Microbulbifer sp. JMSA008 TaxID=3243373 RepID=UPI00403A014A
MLSVTPIPALNDNYIWHLEKDGEHWVVDPGEAEPVIKTLGEAPLSGILITHHHYDHTGGIKTLHKHYECPVFGPESIKGVTNPIADGDIFLLLGLPAEVRGIPGHTLDHLAIILKEESASGSRQPHLFCGDTLFAAGCGRIFEGTPKQMLNSLQMLTKLPKHTLVYCAHEYTLSNLRFAHTVEPGNTAVSERLAHTQTLRQSGEPTLPSSISEELATNPFLRCQFPEVAQSGAHHLGRETPEELSEVEIFSSLRDWKDHF